MVLVLEFNFNGGENSKSKRNWRFRRKKIREKKNFVNGYDNGHIGA